MNSIVIRIVNSAVWLLTLPLALLPLPAALKTGALGGKLFFRLMPRRRAISIENVKNAIENGGLPPGTDPMDVVRGNFESIGKSIMEMLKIYHGLDRAILEKTRVEGLENYKAASGGRGLIMITGHCGNWELMALALAIHFQKNIQVVARAQNNPFLNHLVEKMRSRGGNSVIYKQGAVKRILTELRNNNIVGILIDQAVLVKEGAALSFLGRPAMTTKMPALLALKTGIPVVPCFIHRNGDDTHTIEILPEAKLIRLDDKEEAVLATMQAFTGYVEDYIKRFPEQWLWGHRRWKRAPECFGEGEDPRLLAAAGRRPGPRTTDG